MRVLKQAPDGTRYGGDRRKTRSVSVLDVPICLKREEESHGSRRVPGYL
jgi:hypothetical protein